MASPKDRSFPSPTVREIMRRFQPMGDAAANDEIATDPEAIDEVSQEIQDEVDHARPPFNWPSPSIPQANYFVIEGMALDVLRRAGYAREARSLKTRLHLMTPDFKDLPGLLHRVLDFAPATPLPAEKLAELKALADEMGLDPEALVRAKKKKMDNPLSHRCKNLQEEWAWLVEHAKQESCFGKSAACEMAPQAISRLVDLWLPTIGSNDKGDPTDPSVGNRAWFDANFPLGWSLKIDRLMESACVSAPMEFEQRAALMAYEIASKAERGWPAEDTRRFGFDHMNALGVTGSALIAMDAIEFFQAKIAGSVGKPPTPSASPSALNQHLRRCNPSLGDLSNDMAAWLAYRLADPKSCHEALMVCKDHMKAQDRKSGTSTVGSQLALHEKLELSFGADLQFMEPRGEACQSLPPSKPKVRL